MVSSASRSAVSQLNGTLQSRADVLSGGVDYGLRQIELGMAWHYKAYAKEQARADREAYITSEDKAKADRTGLWCDANPTLPWEFRHPEKAATQH